MFLAPYPSISMPHGKMGANSHPTISLRMMRAAGFNKIRLRVWIVVSWHNDMSLWVHDHLSVSCASVLGPR